MVSPPTPKVFGSAAEIETAIRQLQRRFEQVKALDPASTRYHDAEVGTAESDIGNTIVEIFGPNSLEYREHGSLQIWKGSMGVNMAPESVHERFTEGIKHTEKILRGLISRLEEKKLDLQPVAAETSPPRKQRVFIGHGRSLLWLELRDFLTERLYLEYEEFNRESPAGLSHKERLQQMLDSTAFALLVMTAEDEHPDGTRHARDNVIHEVGLFQGRHGFERAIVLLEEGCEEFGNIQGLNQIRFPKGDVMARSEQIRGVLEREGVL